VDISVDVAVDACDVNEPVVACSPDVLMYTGSNMGDTQEKLGQIRVALHKNIAFIVRVQ